MPQRMLSTNSFTSKSNKKVNFFRVLARPICLFAFFESNDCVCITLFYLFIILSDVFYLSNCLIVQATLSAVTSITDGLKRLYIEKLKPLEVAYHFNDFGCPLLVSRTNVFLCSS